MLPTLEALRASMRQVTFGKVLLLSDEAPPAALSDGIEWRRIERLASRSDYSRFMLHELANHIETSHALCVQWDGYVLNGAAWDAAFLDWDYIGAVWPQYHDGLNVGNGGFSLRSRRLLDACKDLPSGGDEAEDVLICRVHRRRLERTELRFASEAVARTFSFERTPPTGNEFGFHGFFNLVRFLSAADTLQLFRNLEVRVLTRRERIQLLRWAASRGRVDLVLTILSALARARTLVKFR
jgi:hypothetical protein